MKHRVFGTQRSVWFSASAACEHATRVACGWSILLALILVSWCSVVSADVLNVNLSSTTVGGQVPITSQFLPNVVWINFYVDGRYATSTGGSGGTFNWDSTSAGDGTHDIVAIGFEPSTLVSGYSDIRLTSANWSPSTRAGTVAISGYADRYIGWLNLYVDGSYTQSTGSNTWSVSQSFSGGTHQLRVGGYYGNNQLAAAAQISSINFGGGGSAQSGSGPAYFSTIPPGQPLPSEAQCAGWILASPTTEPTSSNWSYNNTTATSAELSSLHQEPTWASIEPASDFASVTGDFVGSTTQIIRWAACKWGIDENYMKADAYWQSTNNTGSVIWDQSTMWDWRSDWPECVTPGWDGWGMYANLITGNTQGCYQSYGLYQLKMSDFNAWPEAHASTSLNADYRGALWRGCLAGNIATYIENDPYSNHGVPYPNSDLNVMVQGCVGINASGHWYDSGAVGYIRIIENLFSYTPWPAT